MKVMNGYGIVGFRYTADVFQKAVAAFPYLKLPSKSPREGPLLDTIVTAKVPK